LNNYPSSGSHTNQKFEKLNSHAQFLGWALGRGAGQGIPSEILSSFWKFFLIWLPVFEIRAHSNTTTM
jgi:hypothetical protein